MVTKKLRPLYTKQLERNKTENMESLNSQNSTSKNIGFMRLYLLTGIGFLSVATFARSGLDAGLKLWVPTMITENYNVSPSFASMLTTILVLINLLGVVFARFMYPKYTKSPVTAFSICFLISIPFTVLLLMTGKINVFWVVLFLTVITTMMYAGHQYINVIIPGFFAKYNKAGAMAAIVNAFASFGIVSSNIGFGWIAEHHGWIATVVSWIILAVAAFLLCLVAVPMWKKFFDKE